MKASRSGSAERDARPARVRLVKRLYRAGAAFLLIGGLLEFGQRTLGRFVSFDLGLALVGIYVGVPYLVVATGLVLFGLSMRGRGRVALVIAGGLSLISAGTEIVQGFVRTPNTGISVPSLLTGVSSFLALIAAVAVVYSDGAVPKRVRRTLLLPALGTAALLSSNFLPLGPAPWLGDVIGLLPSLGFAVAGLVLLRAVHMAVPTLAKPLY